MSGEECFVCVFACIWTRCMKCLDNWLMYELSEWVFFLRDWRFKGLSCSAERWLKTLWRAHWWSFLCCCLHVSSWEQRCRFCLGYFTPVLVFWLLTLLAHSFLREGGVECWLPAHTYIAVSCWNKMSHIPAKPNALSLVVTLRQLNVSLLNKEFLNAVCVDLVPAAFMSEKHSDRFYE